jgi:hypothetical protein
MAYAASLIWSMNTSETVAACFSVCSRTPRALDLLGELGLALAFALRWSINLDADMPDHAMGRGTPRHQSR